AKALGQNKHMLIKQLLQCSLFSCHQSFDHMTFYYRMTSALFTHCSLNVTQTHTHTHTHTHRHRQTHTHTQRKMHCYTEHASDDNIQTHTPWYTHLHAITITKEAHPCKHTKWGKHTYTQLDIMCTHTLTHTQTHTHTQISICSYVSKLFTEL